MSSWLARKHFDSPNSFVLFIWHGLPAQRESISKVSSRMYIISLCKFYGSSREELDLLSVLTYGIELWGCPYYNKYLSQIDKPAGRAREYGYTSKLYTIKDIIRCRDKKLWDKVTSDANNPLHKLLPNTLERSLRLRGHN